MATYSYTSGSYTLKLTVTETSYDIPTNKSYLSYSLICYKDQGTGLWSGYSNPYTVVINGTTVKSGSTTYDFQNYSSLTLASGTNIEVTHNDNGTKTVACSATFNMNNTTYVPNVLSPSGNLTLTTIPRASDISLSVSSATITSSSGNAFTYTITPKSSSFYNRLRYTVGSVASGNYNKGQSSSTITGNFTNSELLSKMPTSVSATLTAYVDTYSDSGYTTLVGTKSVSIPISINTSNIKPTVTLQNISINTSPNANITVPVAGYSKVQSGNGSTNWSASGGYGTNAVTVYFTVSHGSLQQSTYSSASGSNTVSGQTITNTLPASSSNYTFYIYAYAKDSRGVQCDTVNKSITVYGYTPSTANLTVKRVASSSSTTEDGAGTYVYVSFSGTRNSAVNSQNALTTVKCDYSGSISGTINGSLTSGTATTQWLQLDDTQSATFTVTVTDRVTTQTTSKTVNTASYPLDLYDNGSGTVGVGIGTVAQSNWFTSNLPNSFLKKTIMREHYASSLSSALSSSAGYVVLATLTIGYTYANMPIQITTASRGRDAVIHLSVLFNGTNTTDPTLKYFFADTSIDKYWIYKSTTSTWQIISTYSSYDSPAITDVQTGNYSLNRVTIDYTMSYYSAVPEGAVQATAWTFAKADLATRATNATYENWTETNPASQTAYYIPFGAGYSTNTNDRGLFSNNGLGYTTLQGTADTTGVSQLILGNNVASGTAGNKRGQMRLFSNTAYSVFLLASGSMTENTNVYFPKGTSTVETYLKSERRLYNSTLKGGNSTTIANGALFARLRVYGYVGAAEYTIWYIDVNKITTTEMHFNHATPMYISDPGDWYLTIFDVICTKSGNDIVFNLANVYNKRIGTSGQTTQNNSSNYYVYRIDGIID